MKAKVNKVTIDVVEAEILNLPVDATIIVTDPNVSVSDSLAAAVGETVRTEVAKIGWVEVGSAVLAGSGDLTNTENLIFCVGPRWGEGAERGKLANAVWSCMNLAEDNQLASIAMPPISVGTLGYPVEAAAQIVIERIIDFTFEPIKFVKKVTICLPNTPTFDIFHEEFKRQIENLRATGEGKVRV